MLLTDQQNLRGFRVDSFQSNHILDFTSNSQWNLDYNEHWIINLVWWFLFFVSMDPKSHIFSTDIKNTKKYN